MVVDVSSRYSTNVEHRKETGKRGQRELKNVAIATLSFPLHPRPAGTNLLCPTFAGRRYGAGNSARIPASADVCPCEGNKRPPLSGICCKTERRAVLVRGQLVALHEGAHVAPPKNRVWVAHSIRPKAYVKHWQSRRLLAVHRTASVPFREARLP